MRLLAGGALLASLISSIDGCARPPEGPEPSPALRAELEAARDTVWRAWFRNDQEALRRLLPAEFVAINTGEGAWINRDQALEGAQEFARDGGSLLRLGFPESAYQVYGDVAFVYSRYELEILQGSDTIRLAGRSTEVFRRQGRTWINPGWHLDSGR